GRHHGRGASTGAKVPPVPASLRGWGGEEGEDDGGAERCNAGANHHFNSKFKSKQEKGRPDGHRPGLEQVWAVKSTRKPSPPTRIFFYRRQQRKQREDL